MPSWYAWCLGVHHFGLKVEIKRVMDSASPSRLLDAHVLANALGGSLADDVLAF